VATRSGLVPAVVGLASGIALTLIVLRAMRSALFGISATVAVLLLLAALASLLPALRIMRIQPAAVLRAE
jgi:ABC-type antimicrobial peptide transport system permease subunit